MRGSVPGTRIRCARISHREPRAPWSFRRPSFDGDYDGLALLILKFAGRDHAPRGNPNLRNWLNIALRGARMILVTVLYKNTDRLEVQHELLPGHAHPAGQKIAGLGLERRQVQHGLSGVAPGSTPEFLVIAQLKFDSVDAFQSAFGPHAPAVMGDLPNFCSEQPTVQISDLRLG